MRHKLFAWLVAIVAFAVVQDRAWGQVNPLVGPADPTIIQRQMEIPPPPRSEGPPIEAPRRPQAIPEGAADLRFILGGVEVAGNTVVSAEDLAPYWRDRVGQEITLVDVYAIAQAITGHYGRQGYVLSQAVVPAQSIGRDGRVRIAVAEGFIDRVLFEGAETPRLRAIAETVTAERPLTNPTLERALLLVRDLPGVSARAVLRASPSTPNAADLVIVADHKAVDAYIAIDNRGSRYIGPWEATTSVAFNSLLGDATRTAVRVLTTPDGKELKLGDLTHTVAVGADGASAAVSVSRSTSEPGYLLVDEDVTTNGHSASLAATYPLIRSREENLSLTGRFDIRDVETELRGADLVVDRTRVLRAVGTYDFSDQVLSPALTQINAELSQGVEAFGARSNNSADRSRSRGRSDFTKLVGELSRLQRLTPGLNLLAAVKGQWAFTPLLASEEFFVGGQAYGRAYDPAEITGDHGLAGKLELIHSDVDGVIVRDYQLYGFVDGGATWDRDPNVGVESRRTATSFGVGIRTNVNDWASLNLEIAKPLHRVVATQGDDGPRGFLVLVLRY